LPADINRFASHRAERSVAIHLASGGAFPVHRAAVRRPL